MFCRAEGEVRITGGSRLSTSTSRGVPGLPPVSWMIDGPVTLVMAMRARVSVLTGARASARMIAIARRGSFGSSDSSWIEPTAMPLNCTGLPTDRPATDSSNTILYCCQLRSEENLAAHSPNSSRPIAVSRVKAPIST